jgi:DNA-binding transcriptional regulator WhiA
LVKKEIVSSRLEKLREYVAVLKTIKRYDLARFAEDPLVHGAAENKVISAKLLRELEGMAAFRNILVHDYLRLDREKVYQLLQTRLKYIEQLAKVYAGLL